MKYPKASEWPVSHLLSSVNVVREITESIAEQTIMSLVVGGPIVDYSQPTPEWGEVLREFEASVTDEEMLHHVETLEVLFKTGADLLAGFRKACIDNGLMSPSLPRPDNIQLPDSVDDIDW
jgi:hypothetical protein